MDAYAMENWGLITGRASHYLLDPNASNIQQKQAIVNIQFHEVAHMWFIDFFSYHIRHDPKLLIFQVWEYYYDGVVDISISE